MAAALPAALFAAGIAVVLPRAQIALCQTAPPVIVPSGGQTAAQLGEILLGPAQPAQARADAAVRLAALHSPAAAAILIRALKISDPEIPTAVARALAQIQWNDPQFIDPLEALLGPNPVLNSYASQVLSQYVGNASIADRLLSDAANAQLPPAARAPLVRALGSFPIIAVAAELVGMIRDPDESDEVRQAAAVALAEMSGLADNGSDPRKWQTWWQTVQNDSPADFSAAMDHQRAAQFANVLGQSDRLERGLDRLLKSLYFTSQPADQPRLLDSYLTSDAPEIRGIGAQIVEIDVAGGRPMLAAARSRLLELLAGDASASVRAAAAAALGLDATTEPILLARLGVETNPDVQAALLNALALRQDPAVIAQAVPLLASPYPVVAQAAADLIAAGGAVLRDPKQSALRQQVEVALLTALDNAAAPALQSLRQSITAALGALGDLNLYARLQRLASGDDPDAVRVAAIGGLGVLARTNPDIAAVLADFVDSPGIQASLRLKAVQELANVPTTAYIDRLVDRLNRSPDPRPEIRQAIWDTVKAWFPLMDDDRLVRLAERLRNEQDYAREVDVRRYYAQELLARKTDDASQTAASQLETIATRELNNLHQPAQAAADFAKVINYYESNTIVGNTMPANPFRGEAAALLASGPPYAAALQFAAETLADPKRTVIIPDVLEEFPREANRLASTDPNDRDALNKALILVKAFTDAKLKIPPSLSYINDNMAAAADQARQNLAALGPGGQ